MKRRQSLVIGGSLLAASALPARAQSLPVVRVMCTPTDSFGEAYYAQDMGFFAQHNISVEFTGSSGGAIAINALAGNSADVGVANPLSIAQAYIKGIPISILAGGGLYTTASPATLLLIPKDSTVRTPKDLEGKTIGLPGLGDQLQAATTIWLQKNGVDPTKVRFIEVNPGPLIRNALERGRVDAATAPEPTLTESVQAGARVFGDPFAALAPRFFIGVWIARNDWIKANPEVARRFCRCDLRRRQVGEHAQERVGGDPREICQGRCRGVPRDASRNVSDIARPEVARAANRRGISDGVTSQRGQRCGFGGEGVLGWRSLDDAPIGALLGMTGGQPFAVVRRVGFRSLGRVRRWCRRGVGVR